MSEDRDWAQVATELEASLQPAPKSNPGLTAQIHAARYFRDNPEPEQDHRLRSGSVAHHLAHEHRATLTEGGAVAPADALNRFVRLLPDGLTKAEILERARVQHPEWWQLRRSSAAAVLANRH